MYFDLEGRELGALELRRPLGRGGLGQVWSAEDPSGRVVALKLVTSAGSDAALESIRTEAQAMARLEHPNIVEILDFGELSAADAVSFTSGEVDCPLPWLAMEYAEGGELRPSEIAGWGELRGCLLDLLASLAHAHARGVVHRDLKPGNVLGFTRAGRAGYKTTDFGLAHTAVSPRHSLPRGHQASAGTPYYMAPEQVRGLWRDFGPWTDLYALGCIAFQLSTGRVPFVGNLQQVCVQHVAKEPPPLRPRFPVPDGFEHWVARLLVKSPRERFRNAPVARSALMDLAEAAGQPTEANHHARSYAGFETTLSSAGVLDDTLLDVPSFAPTQPVDVQRSDAIELPSRPIESVGVGSRGLGLLALREPPFTGRGEERHALWEGLRTACAGGSETVIVSGTEGVGKSRLARWICETATEHADVGTAFMFGTPRGGAYDGLSGLVSGLFGTYGTTREEFRSRVSERGGLDDWTVEALTQIVHPGTEVNAVLHGAQDRCAVVVRVLQLLAESQPIVLWVDDAHNTLEGLELVHALAKGGVGRLLMVLTVDARPGDIATELLEAIRLESTATTLELGPLSLPEVDDCVSQRLPLTASTKATLLEACGGSASVALALLTEWAESDCLVPNGPAVELAQGRAAGVVDGLATLDGIWGARWQRFAARFADDEVEACAIGAVLGKSVALREWLFALERAGIPEPRGLISDLVESGFAVREHFGWSFVSERVRRLVERGGTGSAARRHQHCADALRAMYGPRGEKNRRVAHLVGAGRPLEASSLISLILDTPRANSRQRNLELVDLQAMLLDDGGLPAESREQMANRLSKVWLLRDSGMVDEALALATEVAEVCGRHGWGVQHALAEREIGLVRGVNQGDRRGALASFDRALSLLRDEPDQSAEGRVLLSLGAEKLRAGDAAGAVAAFRRAERLFQALGDGDRARGVLAGVAGGLRLEGHLEAASQTLSRLVSESQAVGDVHSESMGWLELGEIARQQGRLDEAEGYYGRVETLSLLLDAKLNVALARINRAMTMVQAGRYSEAYDLLRKFREAMHRFGGSIVGLLWDVATARCCLELGHHEELALLFDSLPRTTSFVDPDLRQLLSELASLLEAGSAEQKKAAGLLAAQGQTDVGPI